MRITLEDHVGDIIRKARHAAQVSPEAVARAAGLTVNELAALEATGQAGRPDYQALADSLGLSGKRLAAIAGGWLPEPVDLSQWRELRPIATTRHDNTVNAYLIWDEVTREAALFDTGWDAAPVFALITDNQLELKHLFFTHHHDDHVAAAGAIKDAWPHIRLHSSSQQAPPEQRNRLNDFVHLGSLRITPRATPGHSEDGVTYVIGGFPEDAPLVAVVGDALFAGSMGRGFQSSEILRSKVKEQILSLPQATLLCPGHGPLTTVGEETAHNPFFDLKNI